MGSALCQPNRKAQVAAAGKDNLNLSQLETTGPQDYVHSSQETSPTSKSIGEIRQVNVTLSLPNNEKWGIKLHPLKSGELVLFSADPGEYGYNSGIRNGDVLHHVGDELIDTETANEALKVILLQKMKARGNNVKIQVTRDIMDVFLPSNELWGFQLEELEDFTLQVKSTDRNGHGFKVGIRNGDCLVSVGNDAFHSECKVQEAFQLISKHKTKEENKVLVVIRRPCKFFSISMYSMQLHVCDVQIICSILYTLLPLYYSDSQLTKFHAFSLPILSFFLGNFVFFIIIGAIPHNGKFLFREPTVRTIRKNWIRENGNVLAPIKAMNGTEARELKAEQDLEEAKRLERIKLDKQKVDGHAKLEVKRNNLAQKKKSMHKETNESEVEI